MKPKSQTTRLIAPQLGVSMIELMVGLLIGAIVSVAAVSSFSSTRPTAITVTDSSRLHQDASTAFRTIGHHLRQAGAQQLTSPGGGNVQFNPLFIGYGAAGNPQAIRGTNGGRNAPDVLEVSHDTDAGFAPVDCLGQGGQPQTGITNRFELVGGNLRCLGSGGAVPAPLIEGVEDFQVWYGVRTNGNLQYMPAPVIWNNVESVMVCLRLAGQARGYAGQATTGCNNEVTPNDGRIRRVFVRVFSIRSLAL
jgi:type IV pilus assembly protein PilW